ncbi:MAG TPA: NfeD family protein, partial [Phycisphaeraceae bacterium]
AVVALLALPFGIMFAMKIWPHTPLGRALILRSPGQAEEEGSEDQEEDQEQPPTPGTTPQQGPKPRVGAEGQAITSLRPVGTCLIDGRREECLAVGGAIDPGARVQVVAVDGMHIRVKAVEPR